MRYFREGLRNFRGVEKLRNFREGGGGVNFRGGGLNFFGRGDIFSGGVGNFFGGAGLRFSRD